MANLLLGFIISILSVSVGYAMGAAQSKDK